MDIRVPVPVGLVVRVVVAAAGLATWGLALGAGTSIAVGFLLAVFGLERVFAGLYCYQ